jgi:hypothetical protein
MEVEANLHTFLTTELNSGMWSALRSGRNIPVELLYLSDSRLRNSLTDTPMPPFPHTASYRSTELRLQTVPGSGIGPKTIYGELRQA